MLYWVTDTFPRCIYPYIDFFGWGDKSSVFHPHPDWYCKKPIGYSYFPFELGPVPLAWAETTGNIVWHRAHKAVSDIDTQLPPPPPLFHPSFAYSCYHDVVNVICKVAISPQLRSQKSSLRIRKSSLCLYDGLVHTWRVPSSSLSITRLGPLLFPMLLVEMNSSELCYIFDNTNANLIAICQLAKPARRNRR